MSDRRSGAGRAGRRTWQSWRAAMQDALYAADGFYRSAGSPARHFRTAAHASPLWAAAIGRLASTVDAALDEPAGFTVAEVGAGGGELLDRLAATAPGRWRLVGVDVAPRPGGLAERVQWADQLPDHIEGLLLAVEWLDVVALDVVELTTDGPRLVEVSADGSERLGAAPDAADMAWLHTWWPLTEVGDRAEIGRTRDTGWADALERLDRGAALAVDYAAVPDRDRGGTLTGFRHGRQLVPVPDATMDLTAHVLLDSCAAAAGADATVLLSQREALDRLGVDAARPSYDGDPDVYLAGLAASGQAAELRDPGGLGGFGWLLQTKGIPIPL